MPRFFFHLVNDTRSIPDEEGIDLPNLEAACLEARRTIGAIVGDELASDGDSIHLSIMIEDESGVRVANIEAVTQLVISMSPFAD
jgi:hypothetical protein